MSGRRRIAATSEEHETQQRWAATTNVREGLDGLDRAERIGSPEVVAGLLLFEVAEYMFRRQITAERLRRPAAFLDALAAQLAERDR
jgi:hypothetical protein